MKLTKAQIKGKQEELGRAQAPAALGGGAVLPPGGRRCYPPTSTLQLPGVFRPRPPGVGVRHPSTANRCDEPADTGNVSNGMEWY